MPMANTNQKGRASMKANYPINRHISPISRLSQAYFDKKLKPYGIGATVICPETRSPGRRSSSSSPP